MVEVYFTNSPCTLVHYDAYPVDANCPACRSTNIEELEGDYETYCRCECLECETQYIVGLRGFIPKPYKEIVETRISRTEAQELQKRREEAWQLEHDGYKTLIISCIIVMFGAFFDFFVFRPKVFPTTMFLSLVISVCYLLCWNFKNRNRF